MALVSTPLSTVHVEHVHMAVNFIVLSTFLCLIDTLIVLQSIVNQCFLRSLKKAAYLLYVSCPKHFKQFK